MVARHPRSLGLGVCLALLVAGCSGPDPDLLRDVRRDAGRADAPAPPPGRDAGADPGPPVPVRQPDASIVDVDAAFPTESVDCDVDEEFAVCTRPNADSACLGEECLIIRCLGEFVDCDSDPDTGCETTLSTVEHCGRCGADCALPNVARHTCEQVDGAARCDIDRACPDDDSDCVAGDATNGCKPGFGDCDGEADNGCERPLDTLADCGECGKACTSTTSVVECSDGVCRSVECLPGFGDCDGSGCRSLAADPDNCGSCGNACPAAATECAGGRCSGLVCTGGTADCNGDVGDDCEADLGSVATCGSCDNTCPSYTNAIAGCTDGSCGIDRCEADYDDCDGDRDNGCEVDLTRVESCRACGRDCTTLPHVVSADCGASGCTNLACETGWDDCNGTAADGCEKPLNTTSDCGSCGDACSGDHATASCGGGSCEITACDSGWDDCNGSTGDGCEASMSDATSCGGCGNVCGAGSACVSGGCQCETAAGCPAGLDCCGGGCVNTRSDCFPWPCIPGTNADEANCGACGRLCLAWCCLIP